MIWLRRAHDRQEGAAAIEALGLMTVLIAALVFVLGAGIAFNNLTTMNTAVQNATLTGQATVDRYCTADLVARCATGRALADSRMRSIILSARPQIAFVNPSGYQITTQVRHPDRFTSPHVPTSGGTLNAGPALPHGWGFSYARVDANVKGLPAPFNDLWLGAKSITPGYTR